MVVLAPTGVAALNVGGQTIHSFFGFAPRLLSAGDIKKRKNRKLFKSVEVVVIDEISMVRADLLDNIDYALRLNRDSNQLFGGVQMVFIGDLFQLPPVVATPYERQYFQTVYESPFFFSAKVFEQGFNIETIELRKVYRQAERRFIQLLEAIRAGDVDEDVLEELNQQVIPTADTRDHYISLCARNQMANIINNRELNKLNSRKYIYQAKITGQFNARLYPTEAHLILREGAQVMFVKNDPLKRFVNGTIGKVIKLDTEKIVVQTTKEDKQKTVEVDLQEWEILRYSSTNKKGEIQTETVGSFQQYPLKLAWAITIHKSQGKTFDHVIINMGGGAFEHGQTYVALSRCRTLDGIILRQPIQYRDVMIDDRIIDFYHRSQW